MIIIEVTVQRIYLSDNAVDFQKKTFRYNRETRSKGFISCIVNYSAKYEPTVTAHKCQLSSNARAVTAHKCQLSPYARSFSRIKERLGGKDLLQLVETGTELVQCTCWVHRLLMQVCK